jgi:uncharacterized protein YdeI (YjbR/CyaY-like superfamily)
MDTGKIFYAKSLPEWHSWLKKNHHKEKEVWLVFPKKSSGEKRISYNDAVEEALSFGWIDSIVRRIGGNSTAQRFTPRNPKSGYSQANIERLRFLVQEEKVIPELLPSVKAVLSKDFIIPADILREIKSNPLAYKNFRRFPPAYIRIRIGFIDGARKRPEEFRKRLNYFIKMAEKNKMFGYGGIEKYY